MASISYEALKIAKVASVPIYSRKLDTLLARDA